MTPPIGKTDLLNLICNALDLPKNVFSIKIEASVDSTATIEVGLRMERDHSGIAEQFRRYELHEIKDPEDPAILASPQIF